MKHYRTGYATQCEPPEWVSQRQAAEELRAHWSIIGLLIANHHLEQAETGIREMGVTRISLDREKEWRANASTTKILQRMAKDSLRWISF